LIDQLKTGSQQEQLWAKQALEKMGYQVTMSGPAMVSEVEAKQLYIDSGGDPADFYYDPSGQRFMVEQQKKLDPYKVEIPGTIDKDQARALHELSGGKAEDFYYK
jgi:hypothetical protein